jgi:hypothetical protein
VYVLNSFAHVGSQQCAPVRARGWSRFTPFFYEQFSDPHKEQEVHLCANHATSSGISTKKAIFPQIIKKKASSAPGITGRRSSSVAIVASLSDQSLLAGRSAITVPAAFTRAMSMTGHLEIA